MSAEVWAPLFSLAGVVLGGGLTAWSQRATQRSAERLDERRRVAADREARRTEQVQAVKDFLACVQEAEGVAYRRPEAWGEDEAWHGAASAVMGRLWIAERHLALVCHAGLRDPAQSYAWALNQAVWREIGDIPVNEHVEEHKSAFMDAARAGLAAV
ncbi:hypothetical protein GTW43_14430 [Streptomyces sp. SID5785]|uniref:hypothetical protein n=1 Tax=Streptomyces sp. SID5785 TaxID=2690309 RepID=UPI001361CF97|nr:hypothetical protein [Streptomyces sp. SID5785]MZD06280.1 hypothetical protein [Streptomyces sp. SID5785]